jgi:hypothetical protein
MWLASLKFGVILTAVGIPLTAMLAWVAYIEGNAGLTFLFCLYAGVLVRETRRNWRIYVLEKQSHVYRPGETPLIGRRVVQ